MRLLVVAATGLALLAGSARAAGPPVLGSYTVEYSTNLVNWQPLGPASPRYLFTDTNAPAAPQRLYRLRLP